MWLRSLQFLLVSFVLIGPLESSSISEPCRYGISRMGPVPWVGIADLDGHEPQLIKERQLTTVSPAQLRQNGIEVMMNQIIKQLSNGTSGMYVSVDLDVLDPAIAPGVGTRVAGGLSERELREILRRLGAI